jgi:hypothetical protein
VEDWHYPIPRRQRADCLEAQFQAVNDPSSPAVIEAFDEAMRAYEYAPANTQK